TARGAAMKPTKLLLCVAGIIAICGSCNPTVEKNALAAQSTAATRIQMVSPQPCPGSPTGKDFFTTKVYLLSNFDAGLNGGSDADGYQAPVVDGKKPSADIESLFENAFNKSPDYFKMALCSLDFVFVDTNKHDPRVWGFYESPDQFYVANNTDGNHTKPWK